MKHNTVQLLFNKGPLAMFPRRKPWPTDRTTRQHKHCYERRSLHGQ